MRRVAHARPEPSLICLLPVFLAGLSVSGQSLPDASDVRVEETTEQRLREHVGFLASDELRGRANGSDGLERAADYVARMLDLYGLEPAGNAGEYYQRFSLSSQAKLGWNNHIRIRWQGRIRELKLSQDFEPLTFSQTVDVKAPLVFAGYGITAPDVGYDDYEGVDVEGKIVVMLRFVPGSGLDAPPFDPNGYHATFAGKAVNARDHGAVAALIVTGPLHQRADRLVSFGANVGAEDLPIGMAHVRRLHIEELVGRQGTSLRELQDAIERDMSPRSMELDGVVADLDLDVRRTRIDVNNVVGYLPATGTDGPQRNYSSYLVVGAHYDHLGLGVRGSRARRAKGQIHNGADDNASGVAGLLELARLFSAQTNRARGILFVAFAGEELGLLGSRSFVDGPTLPLGGAIAMLNLDMIGRLRDDQIYLGGLDSSDDFAAVVADASARVGLQVQATFTAERASDHASFLDAGIPSLFFFTGLHGDYHKPSDDVQFIEYDGLEKVVRLAYDTANELIHRPNPPKLSARYRDRNRQTLARYQGPSYETTQRAYFGVSVDRRFVGEGVRISEVSQQGPAAAAGLRPGDVIVLIDGEPIASFEEAARLLGARRPGEAVTTRIQRDGSVMEIRIQLANRP